MIYVGREMKQLIFSAFTRPRKGFCDYRDIGQILKGIKGFFVKIQIT